MNNARKMQPLPVAKVKPGDFPLGSLESRVAARAIAERKNDEKCVYQIQFIPVRDGRPDAEKMQSPPRLIRRVEGADSVFEIWDWETDDV